jgi:hypothetical protein
MSWLKEEPTDKQLRAINNLCGTLDREVPDVETKADASKLISELMEEIDDNQWGMEDDNYWKD